MSFELVPGVAAVSDEGIGVVEHAIEKPVIARKLLDVLLSIELGARCRQWRDRNVIGHHELAREMPAWSSSSAAWRPGAISAEIAANARSPACMVRCRRDTR